jgi:threonine dehydrogenase-like Zn-dependent dehydrogenase
LQDKTDEFALDMDNPSFVLRAVKDVALDNIPKPSITNSYDVIIRIGQTGICGSDVHYWQRGRIGDFILTSPIVLGHESAGTVVEIGGSVKNLRVGDKVAIEPGVPCRHCDYCRSGSYNLCPDTIFAATPPHNGTLSKYYQTAADYC